MRMATWTLRSRSTRTSSTAPPATGTAVRGGCQATRARASRLSPAMAQKADRQPKCSSSRTPSGTPSRVARLRPTATRETAEPSLPFSAREPAMTMQTAKSVQCVIADRTRAVIRTP